MPRDPRTRRRWLQIAPALALLAGCGLRSTSLPLDRSDDQRIQQQVEARLAAEPALGGGTVRVAVEGREVRLHGSVRGIGAWQCALTNAELVTGVLSVVDFLVIERGERDVRCLAPRPDSAVVVVKP